MAAIPPKLLVLSSIVWTLLVVVESHVCLMDPVQRLQTGDLFGVDCYQNGTGPCGKDFPFAALVKPTVVTAGSTHKVKMHRPIAHFNPGVYQTIKLSASKDGMDNFVLLAEFPDEPGEDLAYDVPMPDEPGNYILQANYRPLNYDFYSCADLVVEAAEKSPPSQIDNSNVAIAPPTAQQPVPTTTKRFEQPPPTAPPLIADTTVTAPKNAQPPGDENTLINNNNNNNNDDQNKWPPSFQEGDNANESGQAAPPSQGESSRNQGQYDENSVARVMMSKWLFFPVLLGFFFCFW